MTSLMTSQDHKVGQILKLIYLRQYLSYIVDQKLKMSEMLMAIFLVYSTSGITSGKKVCRELKIADILKIMKYYTQLQFDLRFGKIVPNYAQKSIFMMMTSSMASQGGLKVGPLYSFINEITTFFMITKKRAKISSLNLLCSGHFENFEILSTASIRPQIWKDRPKLCQKSIFMMMTFSMTSQGGLNVSRLYSLIYEITTFFMITKKRAKISSLNFLCICIMRLWL